MSDTEYPKYLGGGFVANSAQEEAELTRNVEKLHIVTPGDAPHPAEPTDEELKLEADGTVAYEPPRFARPQPADLTVYVKLPTEAQEAENERRMLESVNERGEVRMRIEPRTMTPGTGQYAPLLGDSNTIVCRDLEAAKMLRRELRRFLASMDGVVMQKDEGGAA